MKFKTEFSVVSLPRWPMVTIIDASSLVEPRQDASRLCVLRGVANFHRERHCFTALKVSVLPAVRPSRRRVQTHSQNDNQVRSGKLPDEVIGADSTRRGSISNFAYPPDALCTAGVRGPP